MIKAISALILLSSLLISGDYYAKTEPLHKYLITSAVSGKVVFADESKEGEISDETIIKIDNELDLADYEISKKIYLNLKSVYETKLSIYKKIASMSTKSQIEKDTEKIALLNAKNSMYNAELKVKSLEDRLSKKEIKAEGMYVYKIFVKEGAFVNPGVKLAELHDVKGSRLVIFVTKEDIKNIDKKRISVNGKRGVYKVDKFWKVADSEFISNFRVELVGPPLKRYSEVVKVEIKE